MMSRKEFYITVAKKQLELLKELKTKKTTSKERSHIMILGSYKFSGIIDCAIEDSELTEEEFREVSEKIHGLEAKLWRN